MAARRPVLLVVGGCGGLVGRAILDEFGATHAIRSVHRHPVPLEATRGVEWVRADAAQVEDWSAALDGVDTVVALAWYRQARAARFEALGRGLVRLVSAADDAGANRWVHLSVPEAPPELEVSLPYFREKRALDRAVERSRLRYAIVRPTLLFGRGDKLLTVMLRTMARYRRFPMFGEGGYHVSPLAARDLARIVRREAEDGGRRTTTVGGPRRWVYRELTDAMFRALGLPPRYVRLTPRNSMRLARLLETFGSSLLYAYEVAWLLSDRLGPPPYEGLVSELAPVEPFLGSVAAELRPTAGPGGPVRSDPSGPNCTAAPRR